MPWWPEVTCLELHRANQGQCPIRGCPMLPWTSYLLQPGAMLMDEPLCYTHYWISCCSQGDKAVIPKYVVKNFHIIRTSKCKE